MCKSLHIQCYNVACLWMFIISLRYNCYICIDYLAWLVLFSHKSYFHCLLLLLPSNQIICISKCLSLWYIPTIYLFLLSRNFNIIRDWSDWEMNKTWWGRKFRRPRLRASLSPVLSVGTRHLVSISWFLSLLSSRFTHATSTLQPSTNSQIHSETLGLFMNPLCNPQPILESTL